MTMEQQIDDFVKWARQECMARGIRLTSYVSVDRMHYTPGVKPNACCRITLGDATKQDFEAPTFAASMEKARAWILSHKTPEEQREHLADILGYRDVA